MAKSLFIAEKPSVAREFANALKVNGRSVDGYIESENAVVTWCVGHLVTMSYPEVYDMKYKRWSLETLPFLPKEWKYQVIDSVKKQFGIVSGLLNRADVDTIYVCTDSGREGEYIYRLVAQMAGVQGKKQKRVWIDSQTEEEILRGIREAKDLSEYDHLADSAYLRAKEDYLMGINFSRALTLKYGPSVSNYMRSSDRTVISVGRVMTCVLGMVVRREREIREFVKTPFYRVIGTFGPAGISIDGEWRAVEGSRYYGTPCLYKENGFKERKDAEALIAWLWERENGSENSGVMQSEVSDAEKADAGLMGVYNTSQGTILKVEKKKEISDQLFWGISQIVDCFAICDLKNNRYEYEDKRGEYLYPKKGFYDQFIKGISDQYTILTDGENAKFTNMLSAEHVRQLIKEQKDSYCLEYCARDKSRFFIMSVIPVEWEGDTLTKIMIVSQDMGQQHELENLANTDALTGLFNKRYFEKMMEIRDEKKKPYALFYMDLDLFKPVNDTYGHEMGDKVLKEVAKRLLKCIRSNDYAFRIGGDEFMLILNGNLDAQICEKRIERIKKLIGEPYEFDGYTIKIGISCGSAVYPDDADCAADIQKLADKRMYEDKKINHAQR